MRVDELMTKLGNLPDEYKYLEVYFEDGENGTTEVTKVQVEQHYCGPLILVIGKE